MKKEKWKRAQGNSLHRLVQATCYIRHFLLESMVQSPTYLCTELTLGDKDDIIKKLKLPLTKGDKIF